MVLFSLLLFHSCSKELASDPDNESSFEDAHFAATHNSYSGSSFPSSHPGDKRSILEQLDHGVRSIELDVHQESFTSCGYEVGHDKGGDQVAHIKGNPAGNNFSEWLNLIADWSEVHSTHAPITLYIDLKDDWNGSSFATGNFFHLNKVLVDAFGSRLFESAELKPTGWPSLRDLRGRILVVLSGDFNSRLNYLRDRGTSPAVAMNSPGQVVEVHGSDDGALWYWTGQLGAGGNVEWCRHTRYGRGERPAVAINNAGFIVEVHEDHESNDDKLRYRVGKLDRDFEIDWYTPDGVLIPHSDAGIFPTVAFLDLNGASVREVHQSRENGNRWYCDGVFDDFTKCITWGIHNKNVYPQFDKSMVMLGNSSVKVTVGPHGPFDTTTLKYQRDGRDWYRICYPQVAFVESQYGEPNTLREHGLTLFRAGDAEDSDARAWAQNEQRAGRVTRLWQVNLLSLTMSTPVTFPSTDFPFATWYVHYIESIDGVK